MVTRLEKDLKHCEKAIDETLRSPVTAPPRVYHYTSIEGLRGILESGCIRATHYLDFEEDQSEGKVADPHVRSVIRELLGSARGPARHALESLQEGYERLKLSALAEESLFALHVACFCLEAERPALWHKFGRDGLGYCLGILPTDEEYPDTVSHGMRVAHIEYDPGKQRAWLRRRFDTILKIAAEHRTANAPEMQKLVLVRLLMEAAAANAAFKKPQYSEEKEWRLVLMLRSASHGLDVLEGKPRRVLWPLRVGRKPVVLESVHVGARNDEAAAQDVRALLRTLGYGHNGMPDMPEVVLSKIDLEPRF